MKWEHLTFNLLTLDSTVEADLLTHYGSEGWELTAVCVVSGETRYYLKRQKSVTRPPATPPRALPSGGLAP